MEEKEKSLGEKPWEEMTPGEQVAKYYGVPYREPSQEARDYAKTLINSWAEQQKKGKQPDAPEV